MASRLLRARGLVLPRSASLTISQYSSQSQIHRGFHSSSVLFEQAEAPDAENGPEKSKGPEKEKGPEKQKGSEKQQTFKKHKGPKDIKYPKKEKPQSSSYHDAFPRNPQEFHKALKDLRRTFHAKQPDRLLFHKRHIGPRDHDIPEMLKTIGLEGQGLDSFVKEVIPETILTPLEKTIVTDKDMTEENLYSRFTDIAAKNQKMIWMNGQGYFPVHVPTVIKRNLLENPAWYTSYTPYQAEISQGRLQSLLNFQTMVSDLTGLPVANASLLDEGTAAAEAMTMSMNCLPASRAKRAGKTYVVSHAVNTRTKEVMEGRADGFAIKLLFLDLMNPESVETIKNLGDDLVGVMVQYPDTQGQVHSFKSLADLVHEQGALLSAATDLSALTVLTPPGEWGADIAFGNSQRFGVPLGNGGPHAAFFAVKEANKRRLPGRLIGLTKDRLGNPALRLALQTREQHIRREKATSNVCTAQALLANMAAMYAVYHGPSQLKAMAIDNIRSARMVADLGKAFGFKVLSSPDGVLSDTVAFQVDTHSTKTRIAKCFERQGFSIALHDNAFALSISNNIDAQAFLNLAKAFSFATLPENLPKDHFYDIANKIATDAKQITDEEIVSSLPETFRRQSTYLTHPVFNTYHSETEMLRYLHHLQSKDLSQVHSMIPLGSCTMKLNGTSQMELITVGDHANVHPLARHQLTVGYNEIQNAIANQLSTLTGMDHTCLQPNSGAQGEFAGLRVIRAYLATQEGGEKRDICLIPVSAHGTNPASAAMAGMRTVPIKCDTATGNLDLTDLEAKCIKHADELAAIMITYPSTYGVFEPYVKEVCEMVHKHGGLVYMDGANMNAQIGLMSPGQLGADVCHLNLHKTFCIPHGGGGPGVGPICMVKKLRVHSPENKSGIAPVSSAKLGSASILPISWAYMCLMRDDGLKRATEIALLNANYLLARLKDHYPILYTNNNGRCAHEFIIDARPFQKTAGIEVADIAKRLQDYGFHAPTMSWPVPNTLMVEPTESESKEELDRFADALISIRQEIRDIEEGKQPKTNNVLKNSPHPLVDIIKGDNGGWERPYTREVAAYPLPYLAEKKFWPTVGRADDSELPIYP